jgi:FAD synthase
MSNAETTGVDTNTGDNSINKSEFTPPPGYEKMSLLTKPLKLSGIVTKGFQRGSKLLGIPTANIPIDNPENKQQKVDVEELGTGIYFGWAKLFKSKEAINGEANNHDDDVDDFVNVTYKTVVSVGWNPYFKNKEKTIEPYIMHEFAEDFYGYYLQILLCGYLRPELDFTTMENLKKAIHDDVSVSKVLLDQSPYKEFQNDLDNNKM